MDKIKTWLVSLSNGILQNILASVLIALAIPLAGVIYAFSTNNPQPVLSVVLITLVTANIAIAVILLYRLNSFLNLFKEFKEMWGKSPAVIATSKEDPSTGQFRRAFEITDKHFDSEANPQKLKIQFTNRGHASAQIINVKYSDADLAKTAVSSIYTKDADGRLVIPFESSTALVLPGHTFLIEIVLSQIWKREDINRISGHWGYLYINTVYEGKPIELFKSI